MPSTRTSERDGASTVQQELALLMRKRSPANLTADDLLHAFQRVDRRSKGYLSSRSDVIEVLCDAVTAKYQRRIDFDLLFESYQTTNRRFDYTAFCKAFEDHCNAQRPDSPKKNQQRCSYSGAERSPLKSPQKRSNWLLQQQQDQLDDNQTNCDDTVAPAIRVDPRLETQRVLSQSIRRKLVAGVIGTQSNGFQGIQERLLELDATGEGYVDAHEFESQLLQRLKNPLTKQEAQFLVANLRVQTESDNKSRPVIHYEHLAALCNLDSDASADETDDAASRPPRSPTKSTSDPSLSLGGAKFLDAQKRLRSFFQQPMPVASESKHTSSETPRSIPTGAERFLEQAEAVDIKRTGFLVEQDFSQIFHKLGLGISDGLVRAMLERFPRSSDHTIDYRVFLEQYGENPEHTRERRKLKRMLVTVLTTIVDPRRVDNWFQYLAHRCEKYDARLHKHIRGDLPQKEFVHVLRGSSSPVEVPVDDAIAITVQFLRVSRSSRVDAIVYREFISLFRDCHAQANASKREPTVTSTDNRTASASPHKTASRTSADVADYLIHDATEDERHHFEMLMDALHKFQQRILVKQAATTSPHAPEVHRRNTRPRQNRAASVDDNQHEDSAAVSTGSLVGEITPIDNGILLALGNKLQVRIQFGVAEGKERLESRT